MQISRLSTVLIKINQIPYVIFKPRVSFPLNFVLPFSVIKHNSSEIFLLKHYMLSTKRVHECAVTRTLSALMKVHPIPHAIFEATQDQALFKSCITIQCHER